MDTDTIIVGAGIAGTSAALSLSKQEQVMLIDAEEPASGASGVAGGLFSPMFARRGRPIWRMSEAIEAFQAQLDDAHAHHLFDSRGILRPARDDEQVQFFQDSIQRAPDEAIWLAAEASRERYPLVHAPFGAMYIRRGGAVNLSNYVLHLAQACQTRNVELLTHTRAVSWGEDANRAYVDVSPANGGEVVRLNARRVVLALGKGILEHALSEGMALHGIKGQTARLTFPPGLSFDDVPPVSGTGYIIPQPDHVAAGSSFEHEYEDENPSPEIVEALFAKAAQLVPALRESRIIDAQAGIRVSVPGLRLPVVDTLPGLKRVWLFTAFGSKGLLLAPLLAHGLPDYLAHRSEIPPELSLRIKSS